MGVPFSITLYAPSEAIAEAAARAAFARVAELNEIMSDYETDSELSELSRTSGSGRGVRVSPDLWNVLALSQEIAEASGGAFDVTVGPCVALWRKARREQQLPEPARLAEFRDRVGFQYLKLDSRDRTVKLLKPNMRLDLGGIAKGYAADQALKVLRQHGIKRALVAASGDLAIGHPPPGQAGWRIELIGSDIPGAPPSTFVHLANAGVSTSGDLAQRLEIDGVRYSHILDPFTCLGLTNQALTTVIAKTATQSDALETTLTILNPAAALKLANRYNVAGRTIRLERDRPSVYSNDRFQKTLRVMQSQP